MDRASEISHDIGQREKAVGVSVSISLVSPPWPVTFFQVLLSLFSASRPLIRHRLFCFFVFF